MKILGKKMNIEMFIGSLICFTYLGWGILWLFYSRVVEGSFTNPYYPMFDIRSELAAPFTEKFLLGADVYGRSIFEVMSCGLIYSFGISLCVSLISATIGILIGYLLVRSNFFVKQFFETLMNITFILPGILLAILVMSFSGQSLIGLIGALVITSWTGYARITRGEVLRVNSYGYVEASKAVGVSERRLLFKTILPAIFPILLVHIILGVSGVILSESALGFLGLGASEYSWGSLLSMSKDVLIEAPNMVISVSLALAGLVVGLNLLGDGLRDYLDPHSS